ncbi:MAG: TRAP transporter large permease [Deltaproteobacteria bacterium]|nr:TRAP transporter large permease [Deltaproteobacteria bacterium]
MISLLLGAFFLLLLIGTPVAFALGAASLIGLLYEGRIPLTAIAAKIYGGMDAFTLLAVPFFILAGELMDIGGIAQRLITLARVLVGHLRGGLGMVVVVGEIFFSGISGSTTADAAAMGSIMIPSLVRAGYRPERAAAIVSAASGMGILVPPCLSMVVYGAMTNTSIAALFAAGFLPAFVMAAALMGQIALQARREGYPVMPRASLKEGVEAVREAFWALLMPVIIFGGILGGIFTPTEAGVVAVVYGVVAGRYLYRELTWPQVGAIFIRSGRVTGIVMLLVGTANIFAWLLTLKHLPQLVVELIGSVAAGALLFLFLSNLAFILLGALLDGLPAMLMLIPLLFPVATRLGVDPVHYGVLIAANMGMALFMPPAGVGLFITSGIAQTSVGRVTRPLAPYLVTMFAVTLLITYWPGLVLAVPRLLNL